MEQSTHQHNMSPVRGAINSPQVLQLSGIGPANLLNDLEIPLVHDLSGGRKFKRSLRFALTARVKNIDTSGMARAPRLWCEVAKYFWR